MRIGIDSVLFKTSQEKKPKKTKNNSATKTYREKETN